MKALSSQGMWPGLYYYRFFKQMLETDGKMCSFAHETVPCNPSDAVTAVIIHDINFSLQMLTLTAMNLNTSKLMK